MAEQPKSDAPDEGRATSGDSGQAEALQLKRNRRGHSRRQRPAVFEDLPPPGEVVALHVCCGGCATVALERLTQRGPVVAVWYNPNLFPETEHEARKQAARRACEDFGVELVEGPYEHERWLKAVAGLEGEPERGRRCDVCFAMRFGWAADWAARRGLRYLTSTLTVGPQKVVEVIHHIGCQEAAARGLQWVAVTFRKQGGFQRSVQLSRQLGLYRQDYCGCEFSLAERRRQS